MGHDSAPADDGEAPTVVFDCVQKLGEAPGRLCSSNVRHEIRLSDVLCVGQSIGDAIRFAELPFSGPSAARWHGLRDLVLVIADACVDRDALNPGVEDQALQEVSLVADEAALEGPGYSMQFAEPRPASEHRTLAIERNVPATTHPPSPATASASTARGKITLRHKGNTPPSSRSSTTATSASSAETPARSSES